VMERERGKEEKKKKDPNSGSPEKIGESIE
jgi:hypothetical protein